MNIYIKNIFTEKAKIEVKKIVDSYFYEKLKCFDINYVEKNKEFNVNVSYDQEKLSIVLTIFASTKYCNLLKELKKEILIPYPLFEFIVEDDYEYDGPVFLFGTKEERLEELENLKIQVIEYEKKLNNN